MKDGKASTAEGPEGPEGPTPEEARLEAAFVEAATDPILATILAAAREVLRERARARC